MNGTIRQLYDIARREGRGGDGWFVLADRLNEAGHQRLARRLQQANYGWRRLARPSTRVLPPGRSPRGTFGMALRREWNAIRRTLDRLLDRTPSAGEKRRVRRLAARAYAARERPAELHRIALGLAALIDEVGWPDNGNIVPTGMAGPPHRYQVQTLDVWGNAEDGWDINNWFNAGVLDIPSEIIAYNIEGYRDSVMQGYATRAAGEPLIGSVSFDSQDSDAAFARAVRREYLAPGARVVFNDSGSEFVEVTRRNDGLPLLHIQRLEDP